MKYRKKPVVIDAIQWDGCLSDLIEFAGDAVYLNIAEAVVFIRTLEGDMKISNGDYIIKGVNGEFYPCKPDIFEKAYERVDDDGKSG